ncbi:HNH endonuclease [Methylomicrobium agile]|uniref:HNH endonuclease n=1 Tax=Methylomicrobium agile TaxID=39774 RepID=UPI0009FC0672|nr:HNH endonuclease [Methylomicrobium agile]
MTTIRKPWSREETLLAVNLYCRIPFGKQHSRCREVIELATAIGRTPSSVAMKLNNFTSLDPEEQARGVKGLSGASKLDREIWEEITRNWEKVSAKSEYLWSQVVEQKIPFSNLPIQEKFSDNTSDDSAKSKDWLGSTETTRTITARLAQGFFRRTVLASYLNRCCISGIPVSELLVASHILPWADYPDQRVNPCNGLCLSNLHDKAFDRGLITFDEEYRLVLGKRIKEFMTVEALRFNFLSYEGKQLTLPEKFLPDKQSLARHREAIFCSD